MEDINISSVFDRAMKSVKFIQSVVPIELQYPSIGVICGSGLGGLADAVDKNLQAEIPYQNIPHFPHTTVQGHAGKLLFGSLGEEKCPVVIMVGRSQLTSYQSTEGICAEKSTISAAFQTDNISTVTNAAGALNTDYAVGDLVVLNDHLNLAGLAGIHPLRGPNLDDFGVRFPPLSNAYDLDLRRTAHTAWSRIRIEGDSRQLHEGVYAFVGGPSYETRAECRMLQKLGADLVGMSTVPEIIVARHCRIRVLAMSLVTNCAVLEPGPRGDDASVKASSQSQLLELDSKGKADHEEVLEAGRLAAEDAQIVKMLSRK